MGVRERPAVSWDDGTRQVRMIPERDSGLDEMKGMSGVKQVAQAVQRLMLHYLH